MHSVNLANKMIEVFQTNVHSEQQADRLVGVLLQSYPLATITFDLEDCDRILRVAGVHTPQHVVDTLQQHGYDCRPLS